VFPECKNRAECNGAFFCTLLSFLEYAVQKTAEASVFALRIYAVQKIAALYFCTPDLWEKPGVKKNLKILSRIDLFYNLILSKGNERKRT